MPDGVVKRLGRTWQVQEVGELGDTTVQFDLADLFVNNATVSGFTLIIDDDTDFSSGAATSSAVSYTNNTVTFNNVDFEDGDYFTLGTEVPSVAPGGIYEDLLVWLKADVGVVGSDSVSSWGDQSPGDNDFIQGTGNRRPTIISDGINFNPALSFADDNFLRDVDGERYINRNDALSTFVAINADSTSSDEFIFSTLDGTGEVPWSLRFDAAGEDSGHSNTLRTGINTTGTGEFYEADEADLIKDTPQILGVSWSSGNTPNFYVEGRSIAAENTSVKSGTISNAKNVRIGDDNNQRFLNGDIGEVIF